MKRIGFIIFLIGLTIFVNFNVKYMPTKSSNLNFEIKVNSVHADTHHLLYGEVKFYYSACNEFHGELFVLDREQAEHFLKTNEISYTKKFELKDEGMVKFFNDNTGFYTFVIKNTSEKDSHFEYSLTTDNENIKDCIRMSMCIAVVGLIIVGMVLFKERDRIILKQRKIL
ncbi:MAG TPA: hypothetical protein ENG20_02160 [Methanomicrobia archaeon]|nr:hypothetical protein [Methanomicrobia archaeon]